MGSQTPPLRIAIVGAGLGGVLLAVGLRDHAHVDWQLYEAMSSFGEVGLGVSLGGNAQRAMEMIHPQTRVALNELGSTNMWESHRDAFLTNRCAYGPHTGHTFVQKAKIPIRTAKRTSLLDAFTKLLPLERCHFNKRVTKVDPGPSTRSPVTLHFADGTTCEADVVIGADGIHSTVRTHVLGEDHPNLRPQYTGSVVYRGVIPMERVVARLGAEVAQNSHLHFGPGIVCMSYPIERGEWVNFVLIDAKKGGNIEGKWTWPATIDEFREKAKGFSDPVQGAIELLDTPDLSCWALFHHVNTPTYCKGFVTLMGDAAHSTTPHQGSGAGQAVEDALALTHLFGHVYHKADVPKAFAAFDQVRRPRKQRVATTSYEAGLLQSCQAPGIGEDLDLIREATETRLHWIWNRDLQDQNDEIVKIFRESL